MSALPIPLAALEDCGAIFGRRGAGKSGAGRVLFEHELEAGHRCCAIDPKGDWWGIRMDKAGKPSGFDIPIFGGAHGDLALTEDMGEMLGRLIATHDLSCVVDLSAFPSQAAMRRFARDFAEALYQHNTQPITLFLDEADQLAPQRVPAEMARLLHAMENLIRLGRQRGIFMWMLTQRPAVLNTNLRSQAESLIAMKVTTPHDRKAIRDWMDAHNPDQAEAVSKELAKLEVGEAYAWVPSADFLERVRFPLFRTYDSGRTPRHGETIAMVQLPKIDLSAVQDALASAAADKDELDDTIPAGPIGARKKGGDVGRALKERDDRIAELEAEVHRHGDLRQEFYRRGFAAGISSAIGCLTHYRDTEARHPVFLLEYEADEIESQAKAGDETTPDGRGVAEPVSRPAAGRSAAATAERMAATAGETAPPRAGRSRSAAEGLEPLNATALAVAALLRSTAPDAVAFNDALLLLGRRPGSGDAGKARKGLKAHGLVDATGDGIAASAELLKRDDLGYAHWPSAGELVVLWENKLRGPGGEILRCLFDHGPASKDTVAQRLGKSPISGWFGKGMKDLRRSNIIVETGRTITLHPFFVECENG